MYVVKNQYGSYQMGDMTKEELNELANGLQVSIGSKLYDNGKLAYQVIVAIYKVLENHELAKDYSDRAPKT